MSENAPIIYIDHSEVLEGKLEELKTAITELAELVKTKEPDIVVYNAYFSQDGKQMTVIHVHPDSASLEFHGKAAGSSFARFAALVRVLTIDVYGQPGNAVMEQLHKKAKMLGNATVTVHRYHAGFARLDAC